MDKKLRSEFAKGNAINDQAMAAIWERIKGCYRDFATGTEYVRTQIAKEIVAPPLEGDGPIGFYHGLKHDLLTIGSLLLQEKLAEWMENGEIPQGKLE